MSTILTEEVKIYWNNFLNQNPHLEHLRTFKVDAWSFGNTPEMANELVELVLQGKKVATCSLLRAYNGYEDEIPKVGVYSIICDGQKKPKCIVFYNDTFIRKYNEVDEKHAYEEGEGDQSLEYWRRVHTEFFSRYGDFSEDEDLLCERFRVVYN